MLVNLRTKCFNIKTLGLKMKWVEKSVTKNLNFLIINLCLHFLKLFLPLVSGKTVYGNFVSNYLVAKVEKNKKEKAKREVDKLEEGQFGLFGLYIKISSTLQDKKRALGGVDSDDGLVPSKPGDD